MIGPLARAARRRRRWRAPVTGALVALAAWGCEGQNLFGPGVGIGPQIINFLLPPSVMSGGLLSVETRAVALVRVDSIVLTATGGEFAFRRVQMSQNNETDFSAGTDFEIPKPITDTLVVVTAIAYDAQGNRSLPSVDTVRAIDTTPPTTTLAVGQGVVGQGKSFDIEVQGEDNIGLRAIGYQMLSPAQQQVARDSVLIGGLVNVAQFTFDVPIDFPLGDYALNPFAWDLEGNFGMGMEADSIEVIFIDEEDPVVDIQLPAPGLQVAEADSVLVRVRVTDNDKVSLVRIEGVAFRGDPDLGTFEVIDRYNPWNINLVQASADTTLTRFLKANALIGAEMVQVIVTATDRQDNVSADTVSIQILADESPPVVVINAPGTGAIFNIGDSISLLATVSDPNGFVKSGVVSVRFQGISLRGDPDLLAEEEIVRFQPREVQLDPPRILPQQILRLMIPVPDTTEEAVHFIVTATDARGNVAADTITVTLTATEELAPSIQILNPTVDSGSSLTDSIFVRARIQHPIGVARVIFSGVAHRGDRDLGTHQEVLRYAPKVVDFSSPLPMDTIIARFLQPLGTVSESVYIRVVAEDAFGVVGRDSVLITMGGPSVQLPDLVDGQSISAGQALPIRVTATDPAGVNLVRVEISGADTATLEDFVLAGQNPNAIDLTFDYTIPALASGPLTIRATARNTNGIFGTAPLVTLNVISGGGGVDGIAPEVRILIEPQGAVGDPNRIEVTDSIRVSVTARDNAGGSGVQRTGYTVRVVRRDNQADTLWLADTISTGGGVGGTVTRVFRLRALEDFVDSLGDPFYDPVNRPDTLDLDFFGWSMDAMGNCAAAVSSTLFQRLGCATVTDGGDDFTVATGETGQHVVLALVSGETVRLPAGGSIADAAIHAPEGLLILSNISLGHLEVFDLATRTYESPILVGSDPWGLAPGLIDENLLFVANSGGTNISRVDVGGRMELNRISTPNTLLWDVQESVNQGQVNFTAIPFDFSDRPQFVAEDVAGRLVYSTRPTGAAPDGTIRLVDFGVGPTPEVLLFTGHGRTTPSDGWRALGNVDRAFTEPGGIFLRTHQPGTPATEFTTAVYTGVCPTDGTCGAFAELLGDVSTAVPADPLFWPVGFQGRWDIESVGLTDTTFIARSGDGSVVAIGEGATATTGRIFLWRAADESITDAITVVDLVGNAAERVLGVAMNQDGTMGVGRGLFGVYFFDRDLRLIGSPAISAGGGGVALHPTHTGEGLATPANRAYAFVPVGNNRVEIYDTRNYFRSGHVHIRDTIVGPVRSTLPFPGDNAGLTCGTDGSGAVILAGSDDACVAVKLYGVGSQGGVVVINVTKADILRGP